MKTFLKHEPQGLEEICKIKCNLSKIMQVIKNLSSVNLSRDGITMIKKRVSKTCTFSQPVSRFILIPIASTGGIHTLFWHSLGSTASVKEQGGRSVVSLCQLFSKQEPTTPELCSAWGKVMRLTTFILPRGLFVSHVISLFASILTALTSGSSLK